MSRLQLQVQDDKPLVVVIGFLCYLILCIEFSKDKVWSIHKRNVPKSMKSFNVTQLKKKSILMSQLFPHWKWNVIVLIVVALHKSQQLQQQEIFQFTSLLCTNFISYLMTSKPCFQHFSTYSILFYCKETFLDMNQTDSVTSSCSQPVENKHCVTCTEAPRGPCPGSHDLFLRAICQWGTGNLKKKKNKKTTVVIWSLSLSSHFKTRSTDAQKHVETPASRSSSMWC